MPDPTMVYSTIALTNAAESANNAETIVATLTGVLTRWANQAVRLDGWMRCTTGTGTTAGLLRIRKNGLTGTVISDPNADNQQIALSKVCEIATTADDVPGEGIFTYVLTYVGTGDTAVTTFNAARLRANVG